MSEMVQIDQKSIYFSKLVKACTNWSDFTKLQTLDLMKLETYKNLESEFFVHFWILFNTNILGYTVFTEIIRMITQLLNNSPWSQFFCCSDFSWVTLYVHQLSTQGDLTKKIPNFLILQFNQGGTGIRYNMIASFDYKLTSTWFSDCKI